MLVVQKKLPNTGTKINTKYTTIESEADIFYTNKFQASPPILVPLTVNDKRVDFELDTGSALTLCSAEYWSRTFGRQALNQLKNAGIRLNTYTGEQVELLGSQDVENSVYE